MKTLTVGSIPPFSSGNVMDLFRKSSFMQILPVGSISPFSSGDVMDLFRKSSFMKTLTVGSIPPFSSGDVMDCKHVLLSGSIYRPLGLSLNKYSKTFFV
jgi:hypothetical protein